MKTLRSLLQRYRRPIAAGVVLIVIALGFLALNRLTQQVRYSQVRAAVHDLSLVQIALSLALTAASYLALTFYDVLALRVIDRPLPWRKAALASFSSYTLSHNLGLALLTGGSARYRVYAAAGLEAPDIARVVGIAAAMFWVGVVTVASAALLLHHGPLQLATLSISEATARMTGAAILAMLVAMIVAGSLSRSRITIFGFKVPLPRRSEMAAQVIVSVLDISCASAALFVLLPAADPSQLPAFILAYALGIIAALVSHVPGGVGIFESVVLAVVPSDRASLFAALIAYRVIYYLLPLALGVVMLAWHEARRSTRANRVLESLQAIAVNVAPPLLSLATFLGGAMLLLSGSLPAIHARMGALGAIVPLPFIEASHIAASLCGTALLLLAPGLYRRLDGACLATRALLVAGAVFSLAKGIDYEEASACLGLAALLHLTRHAFYRRTALIDQPLTAGWLTATASVAAIVAWSGLFAYRHVPYSDDLWWNFALHGDAPRYMRATLASAVVLTGFAVWRLMRPSPTGRLQGLDDRDWPLIRQIVATSGRSEAMLALTGDKRFLISEARDAFLMYQVKGASWIVMGDPVGAREAWPELLWSLRALSHRQQGRILLYEVSPAALDLAIGLGLQLVKFGEEAVIDLPAFTLDTPDLRSVRKSRRVAQRAGATLRIVPAPAVPVILDELEQVSNEWMAAKGHQEKGFSLGRFDRAYLSNFDVALVMVEDRIVAFANLWLAGSKAEISVDLMRYRDEAPPGTMDFLFAGLMLWAKDRGYQRFILGMVPLSGIDGRALAPAWAKAAALIFRLGETFYGFRGLRSYKEKFSPRWEPRYVAGPQGVGLLQALHDVSRLISAKEQGPGPGPAAASQVAATAMIAPAPAPALIVPRAVKAS